MLPNPRTRARSSFRMPQLAVVLAAAAVTSAAALGAAWAPPPSGGWLPPATAPKAPSNLRLTGGSCNYMRLEWDDNSSNESGFQIRYEIAGWNNWQTINVGPNVRSVNIPISQCVECLRNVKVRAYTNNILYGTLYSSYSSTLSAGVSLYCLW